jgi:rhodanese-related sulfurtransferase
MFSSRHLYGSIVTFVALLCVLTSFNGCRRSKEPSQPTKPIPEITLPQLEDLLKSGNVLLFDARPRFYYDQGHIPGALPLSPYSFSEDYSRVEERLRKSSTKKIVVYCGDFCCPNAHRVAQLLTMHGYSVAVFTGGWIEWRKHYPAKTS